MTFLPIVERELRVRARWPSTYNSRWVAVAVALLVGLPLLAASNTRRGGSGHDMFMWLGILALLYCLFEGAHQTADSLSSERRAGTLGLLFLTDLKGYDVVLGKIAGTSLSSVYGLLAVLPVLGLSLLTGGVTGGEFWRIVLVLLVTLFFSLSVGICVSARSREEQKAMAAAGGILIGITGALPCLDMLIAGGSIGAEGRLALASPAYAFYQAFDPAYKTGAPAFWSSLPVIMLLSAVFLSLASTNAGKDLEEASMSEGLWQRIRRPFVSQQSVSERADCALWKREKRRLMLHANPVLWLVSRKRGVDMAIWLSVGLSVALGLWQASLVMSSTRGSFIWFPWAFSVVANFVFWFCAARLASKFFVEARQGGALELLLVTPLRDRDIMRGLWVNLRRVMIAPLILLWLMQVVQFLARIIRANSFEFTLGMALPVVFQALGLWIQALTLCWVGMWLGLSSKKPTQAPIKTFLYVVLLPWVFCSGFSIMGLVPGRFSGRLPWFTVSLGMMIVDWLLLAWAKNNMHEGIRAKLLREISGPPSLEVSQLTFENDFFVRR